MTYTEEEARAAVARGALLLTAHVPGWARLINTDCFNMRSISDCMLGQAGHSRGGFVSFTPELFAAAGLLRVLAEGEERDRDYHLRTRELLHEYGFDLPERAYDSLYDSSRMAAWTVLEDAWRDVIAAELVMAHEPDDWREAGEERAHGR